MDDRDKIIKELRALVAAQAAQLKMLETRISELELALAKSKKDSSNSSMSPSSDIVKPKKKNVDRRRKAKQGGQKGHQRNLRVPLPSDRVDEQITHEFHSKDVQKFDLTPTEQFEIIQRIELLDLPIHVTEHRLRKYLDTSGKTVLPDVADLKGQPIFGPRMLAMIGWLKSRAHCSYSTIALWMGDVLQVDVSRGYLSKLCNHTISTSLADNHEKVQQAIGHQPQLGSDETSFKNNGKKNWIWCITASLFTFFKIAATRSRSVLEEIIGLDYRGTIHCDYFSSNCSFVWNFNVKAQYCWAHLIREIRFLQKHPDNKTKAWSEKLQDRSRKIFKAYHSRSDMSESGFHRSMLIQRDRFLEIVRKPPDCKEAYNLSSRFGVVEYPLGGEQTTYDMSQDYFRFMLEDGVDPTNNHSEQQVRHCVIDRKITQGTRSLVGQRYHERMWTAIATCQKQNRSFFTFLHAAIKAKLNRETAPSLIQD